MMLDAVCKENKSQENIIGIINRHVVDETKEMNPTLFNTVIANVTMI